MTGTGDGRPPVWILRQAGRYLPGYRELRRKHSFVEMCTRPDLAVEVSLEPYRRFGFDAVIVFYDILFLAEAMGAPVEFTDRGPVLHSAVRDLDAVRRLRRPEPREHTGPVLETLRVLRRELPGEVALLGFAGAPFTMAAYLVEGDLRRSGERVKRLMYEAPDALHELLGLLADATADYLRAQVEAGAGAVQLFDTWAGLLSVEDYRRFALPYQQAVFEALRPSGVPAVLYVNGSAHVAGDMARSGASVLSLDWRVSLAEVRRRLGGRIALQGNLEPAALFASPEAVRRSVQDVLDGMSGDPAYIFNLGHGILPETPLASVEELVAVVRGS
jgi:uroporphyrinogen decarboxylase